MVQAVQKQYDEQLAQQDEIITQLVDTQSKMGQMIQDLIRECDRREVDARPNSQ